MKRLLLFGALALSINAFGQVPNYVPTNGLVGWWPFNGNANDESGNGNNGTVNGAALTTDRFGNSNSAYDIIPGQYIGINDSPSLNWPATDALSISVWLYRRNSSGAIISKWGPMSDPDDEFILSQQSGNYLFAINSSGSLGSPNFTWNNYPEILNQWIHLTCTFDGSNSSGSIYINSIPIYTDNTTISSIHSTIEKLYFGRTPTASGYIGISDMIIDDIGIWNRALSQCEISALYNSQTIINGTDIQSACDSYTWVDGNTYTTSNNSATYLTSNAAGCDSTVTLDLTITNATSSTDTQSACDSYTWVDGNIYTSSNNSATYTASNAAGCDSLVTLDLTITPLPDNNVTQAGSLLTADQAGATYQWLDCDNNNQEINGEINQFYTPAVTGNYAIEVTLNGCVDTSACFLVDYTGIEELLQNKKELVKIVDFMGRETEYKPNIPLIFIYSDGTRERVMKIEE